MIPAAPTVLNIAHRGARAFAPENTLAAFAKAKSFGCQMIELDVRLSKDGEAMVFHDEDLIRCTNATTVYLGRSSYKLADYTRLELGRLDAGSWYAEQLGLANSQRQPFLQSLTGAEMADFISPSERKHYASGNIQIPTLAETLVLAKEIGLMVNVELKNTDDAARLVTTVLALIQAMKMEDKILVSSFEHDLLRLVRQQTKNLATAILVDKPLRAPVTYLRRLKANACNLGCYHDFRTIGFGSLPGKRYLTHLRKIKKAGFGLNIWTCNDPEEMGFLLETGVTGIISDYPNRVSAVLVAIDQNR